MLKEAYIALWKKYPTDEVKIMVARPSVLSPSKVLLEDYRNGRIDWAEYERRFRKEIRSNREALVKLVDIWCLAKESDVRLMCYEKNPPCHRFVLMDLVKEMFGK